MLIQRQKMQNSDIRTIEKKIWISYFQDGLIDIFIGCVVLLFAIASLLSERLGDFWSSFIFLPFWALIYLCILLIKKYILLPRIGVVHFGPMRTKKLLTFNIIMVGVLSLGFVLGIISFIDFNLPRWIHLARFGLIVLIGSILAGYYLDFPHLYLYGFLFVLSLIIGEWLWENLQVPHHGFPVIFGFTAGLIIFIGLIKFIRLHHQNPVSLRGDG